MRTRIPLALFSFVFSVAWTLSSAAAQDPPNARTFAVETGADSGELAGAIRSGSFERWYASRDDKVELAVGPDVTGDVEVEAQLFPPDERLRGRLRGLPVDLSGEGITLGGTLYPNGYALALRIPEAAKPTWLVVGYDIRTVAGLADQVLWSETDTRFHRGRLDADYLVWEHHYSNRSGKWVKTENGYALDPNERDDIAARAATYAALVALERANVVLRVPVARARDAALTDLADRLDAAVAQMATRVPVKLGKPLEILVENDYVEMGRHLAEIGEAVVDGEGRLHVIGQPEDFDAYAYGAARLLIRRAGLELPPRLEDGAALWLSQRWYGRTYADWLPDLAFAKVLPDADDVFADFRPTEVLNPPIVAGLVARLAGDNVRDKLAQLPSTAWVAAALGEMAKAGERPSPVSMSRRPPRTPKFQNGVSLAMLNDLEMGYHAPGIDDQLVRLHRLGADSVSLMPFAGQSSPTHPELSYYNGGPSSETDVGLVYAARRAHARGFRVLWKPHVWVGHDSWPGEIMMTSEQDWQTWWSGYRHYVMRHAVLAEWTGSELFSVGVELGKTLGREAEWRHLIRSVRRVFQGDVTYCGNWWGDYDQAPFWDELDYVGVDAYFPLAHEADADRKTLEAGAAKAVAELRAASERFAKPVLLTEVGFAARKGAWVSPHEEGGEYSEEHQALAYEVLLQALGRPDWLQGLYLWKVFSHPSVTGGERPNFSFLERGAEVAVRSYFRSDETPATVTTAD